MNLAVSSVADGSDRRTSVHGGVEIEYARRDGGGTALAYQSVRPPLHLAKTFEEDGWAVSLLTSPTAGLLEGDRIRVDCRVKRGARAAVISPAACRVHRMAGGAAEIEQRIAVESGGMLDIWPAPLVLQEASVLRQRTRVRLDEGASLVLTEVVTPGRIAHGEAFAFTEWASRLEIRRGRALSAFEQFQVRPADDAGPDWRAVFPGGSYASLFLFTDSIPEDLPASLHAAFDPSGPVRLGASPLRDGGLGIKVLAEDGVSLRKAVLAVRAHLAAACSLDFPRLLRRGQTFFH